MYLRTKFTDADPSEDEPYGFNFRPELIAGEAIQSAQFFLSVMPPGMDDVAASRLQGSVQITGTVVSQRIVGLLSGRTYKLRCVATTSVGKRALVAYVDCRAE